LSVRRRLSFFALRCSFFRNLESSLKLSGTLSNGFGDAFVYVAL
jgi:hypothetical protein